jgi:hypothetical protein
MTKVKSQSLFEAIIDKRSPKDRRGSVNARRKFFEDRTEMIHVRES